MLSRIFPKQIDNAYRGYRLAIWLFVPIVLVNMIMGANTMINTRDVIQGADRIPLDSYGAAAARIIVNCFKSWGLGHFLMASLGLLALVRYRTMVPLMYLVFTLENGVRKALQHSNPFHITTSSGEPMIGARINLALLTALLIGFVLSLGGRGGRIGTRRAHDAGDVRPAPDPELQT
jgi:hypothetical protein